VPTSHARQRLGLLYVALFDDCNVRCDICDCWRRPPDRRTTPFYLAKLTLALSLRPQAVRFTGGEPLLLAGLPTLVATAAQTGARVSVITNGRLLQSKAASLADSGCHEIVVSIDGVGDAHDQMRGTPRLFHRLSQGVRQVCRTRMTYGVNTVVRSTNIATLATLADFLCNQPRPPSWWHLIPVRDRPALVPSQPQRDRFHATLGQVRSRLEASGTAVVADENMFDEHTAVACDVPDFAAFLRADTGELFGCNMLAYSRHPIGSLDTWTAFDDPGLVATALRQRCHAGTNPDCGRCDRGSRAMNHHLLHLAQADPTVARTRPVIPLASEVKA
jgi:MoaA/NifB/PqqE/SkfB family radical SAM enzyme